MNHLARAWLHQQCQSIGGVVRAVVVQSTGQERPPSRLAYWPETDAQDTRPLDAVVAAAMAKRRPLIRRVDGASTASPSPNCIIGYPLLPPDGSCWGVALELSSPTDGHKQSALRLLSWGAAWLTLLVRSAKTDPDQRLALVLELMASCLDSRRFRHAAGALVSELAARLPCDWVGIGFLKRHCIELNALSHSTNFDNRSRLVRDLCSAMEEAADQTHPLAYPSQPEHAALITRAHRELAKGHRIGALCTVPMYWQGRVVGAITLARGADQPFDAATIALCEHLCSLIAPILELKRRDERALHAKAWDRVRTRLITLFGPGHFALKCAAVSIIALLSLTAIFKAEYKVAAKASLEASIQRVIVAPMDGYIAEAGARPGDVVRKGDMLAVLDRKELELQRLKWLSEHEKLRKEYREALARHERSQVSITSAQIEQAKAQLDLVEEQLARSKLTAPFDGVVVKGDLSQSLGSPIERGEVLFEVAPLDGYRVVLEVDESEIAEVCPGLPGQLVLSGAPGEALPLTVNKITPVAEVEDGLNHFRVEAELEQLVDTLRPGMEGIGKIAVGKRNLTWIASHRLLAWLRLWFWAHWP